MKILPAVMLCLALLSAAAVRGSGSSLLDDIKAQEKDASSNARRLNDNFLLVKADQGRGSAFRARLGARNVIITNAHVYLEMENPVVQGINGRIYRITEVLGSKSRDLVILAYEPEPDESEALTIVADAAGVPVDTALCAYGNSLGSDVIVEQHGKLLGIGPDKIETDAGFVGGNSGGPLLLENGEVIGVATYLQIVQPNATTTGSKYESSKAKEVVRRFATRVDNLRGDDFEVLDVEEMDKERRLVAGLESWIADIRSTFQDKVNEQQIVAFRQNSIKRCSLYVEAEDYEWRSTYMKNKFEEQGELIKNFLNLLELDGVIEIARIAVMLDVNAAALTASSRKPAYARCAFCLGTGKVSETRKNPAAGGKNRFVADEIITHRNCTICHGNGTRLLWDEMTRFMLPEALHAQICESIRVSDQRFGDFLLGNTKEEEWKRLPFYRKQPVLTTPNPFGETLFFSGNHKDRDAACTILVFMFGRLLGVQVVYEGIYRDPEAALQRCVRGEVADSSPFFCDVSFITRRGEVPFAANGNLLLKKAPQPVGITQEERYEGTIVSGMHVSLLAVGLLDLPSLRKKAMGK